MGILLIVLEKQVTFPIRNSTSCFQTLSYAPDKKLLKIKVREYGLDFCSPASVSQLIPLVRGFEVLAVVVETGN